MSQLVCYSEGQREAGVLADAATAMCLTYPSHMGQTQSLTGHVDSRADVLPGKMEVGQNNRQKREMR